MPSWADNWAWLLHSVHIQNKHRKVYDTIMTWIRCSLNVYCREASFEAGKTQARFLFCLVRSLDTLPHVQSLEMASLFCSTGNYVSKTSLYNIYIHECSSFIVNHVFLCWLVILCTLYAFEYDCSLHLSKSLNVHIYKLYSRYVQYMHAWKRNAFLPYLVHSCHTWTLDTGLSLLQSGSSALLSSVELHHSIYTLGTHAWQMARNWHASVSIWVTHNLQQFLHMNHLHSLLLPQTWLGQSFPELWQEHD